MPPKASQKSAMSKRRSKGVRRQSTTRRERRPQDSPAVSPTPSDDPAPTTSQPQPMMVAIHNSDQRTAPATSMEPRKRSRRERAARVALPRKAEYALIRDDLVRLLLTAAVVTVIMVVSLFALT